jgi:hypothetical protein
MMRILLSVLLVASLFPASVHAAGSSTDESVAGSTTLSISVYQVTVDCGSCGSFTVDGVTRTGSCNFYTNDALDISLNPNAGYVVNDTAVASGTVEMTVSGKNITLNHISSDVVLRISFLNTTPAAAENADSQQTSDSSVSVETEQTDQTDDMAEKADTADDNAAAQRNDAADDAQDDALDQADDTSQDDAPDNANDVEESERTVLSETITADITLAEVEGDAVIITSDIAESLTIDEDGTNVMVIPLNDRNDQVTKVSLSKDSLVTLAEDKNGILRIRVDGLEAELDNTALLAIISQAQGDYIYIDIKQIEATALSETQLDAVQDKAVLFCFTASVISGDVNISQFYEGRALIKIPFEPEEGVDVSEYAVVYIPTEGDPEVLESSYEDGCITFSISHFSEYAIVRNASLATGIGLGAWYMWIILLLIILAALCIIKRRRD